MSDTENTFRHCTTRDELLGQLAGAASTCWENLDGAGVFQSERASDYVIAALERLFQIEAELAAAPDPSPGWYKLKGTYRFADSPKRAELIYVDKFGCRHLQDEKGVRYHIFPAAFAEAWEPA